MIYLEIVMSEMEMDAIVESPGSSGTLLMASLVTESTCAGSILVFNSVLVSLSSPVRTSAVEAVETSG